MEYEKELHKEESPSKSCQTGSPSHNTPVFVAVVIIAVSGFANVIDIAGPVAAVAVKASGTGYHGLPGILNAIRS